MAAGLGFKTFNTGDVLTASDTNGYLMQGVWVFASAAARTSAVTSPQEGNVSFLKDTNSLEIYDGAAWVAYGSGDITGVTAGTGISGGGTSGTVTVTNSMATAIDAKGDIIAGTGADTFDRLAVGTNGQFLTADSSTSTGLKWSTSSATSYFGTVLASGTLSGVSLDLQSISGSYTDLVLDLENPYGASAAMLKCRLNNESGAASHGYYYTKTNDTGVFTANSTEMQLGVYGMGSNANTSFLRIIIPKYATANHRPVVNWTGTDTADSRAYWGFGYRNNSSDAINRIQVYMTSVSFSGGTYKLYGVN